MLNLLKVLHLRHYLMGKKKILFSVLTTITIGIQLNQTLTKNKANKFLSFWQNMKKKKLQDPAASTFSTPQQDFTSFYS